MTIHEGPAAEEYTGMFDQLWDAAAMQGESGALIGRLDNDLPIDSMS